MSDKLFKTYVIPMSEHYIGAYDLSGHVDEVIKKLNDLKSKYGPSLEIEIELGYQDYSNDRTIDVILTVEREETDEEFAIRIKQNEESKEARRQSYERLKKEFGE